MIKAAIVLLVLALTSSCAPARGSGGASASIISGPPGYDCFGIYDGDGKLVGGNCSRM